MHGDAAGAPALVARTAGRRSGSGLSSQLAERLAAWAAFFNEQFHEDHGFPTIEMARKHRAEGIALQPLVAEELGPHYQVVGDFWETEELGHPLQVLVKRIVRAVTRRGH